jgi:hypothetical protein
VSGDLFEHYTPMILDKTLEEVIAAYKDGKKIECHFSQSSTTIILPLVNITTEGKG